MASRQTRPQSSCLFCARTWSSLPVGGGSPRAKDGPRPPPNHLPRPQMLLDLPGHVARWSRDAAPCCCRHPNLDGPNIQQYHLSGLLERHDLWPESAAHSSTDLGPCCCHHQNCCAPTKPHCRLFEEQQKHILLTGDIAHVSTDAGHCCYHLQADLINCTHIIQFKIMVSINERVGDYNMVRHR